MKRDYLSRLTCAARWYLPPAEAAEVLEDYREIVGSRSEEELRRDIGTPRAAVRQLAQPKTYRRWLTVFGILLVCLLFPAADTLLTEKALMVYRLFKVYSFGWESIGNTAQFAVLLFPLGTVLAWVWFQRSGEGEPDKKIPKGIVPLLIFMLLGMAWVWFLAWVLLAEQYYVIDFLFPHRGSLVSATLGLDILLKELIGIFGLLKARLKDRRWRAVYVMGLAGAVLSIYLWSMLTHMSFDYDTGWQTPHVLRIVFISAAGLIGTAVSLC